MSFVNEHIHLQSRYLPGVTMASLTADVWMACGITSVGKSLMLLNYSTDWRTARLPHIDHSQSRAAECFGVLCQQMPVYRVWESSLRLWRTISKPLWMWGLCFQALWLGVEAWQAFTNCVNSGKARLASLAHVQTTEHSQQWCWSTPGIIVCVWHRTQHLAFRKTSVSVSWSSSGRFHQPRSTLIKTICM